MTIHFCILFSLLFAHVITAGELPQTSYPILETTIPTEQGSPIPQVSEEQEAQIEPIEQILVAPQVSAEQQQQQTEQGAQQQQQQIEQDMLQEMPQQEMPQQEMPQQEMLQQEMLEQEMPQQMGAQQQQQQVEQEIPQQPGAQQQQQQVEQEIPQQESAQQQQQIEQGAQQQQVEQGAQQQQQQVEQEIPQQAGAQQQQQQIEQGAQQQQQIEQGAQQQQQIEQGAQQQQQIEGAQQQQQIEQGAQQVEQEIPQQQEGAQQQQQQIEQGAQQQQIEQEIPQQQEGAQQQQQQGAQQQQQQIEQEIPAVEEHELDSETEIDVEVVPTVQVISSKTQPQDVLDHIQFNDCQFDTRTLGNTDYLFSRNKYTYEDASSMCRRCGSELANVNAANVYATVSDAQRDSWWIGSYDGGEVVPYLVFGSGPNPFVVAVDSSEEFLHKAVCAYGQMRRRFCTYIIIDSGSASDEPLPTTSPSGLTSAPCWHTSVLSHSGEFIEGASARICLAEFNETDLSESPGIFTDYTTINLPNNDSFTIVSEVSISPLRTTYSSTTFTNFVATSNTVPTQNFGIQSELGTGEFQGQKGMAQKSGLIDASHFAKNGKLRFNQVLVVSFENPVSCY